MHRKIALRNRDFTAGLLAGLITYFMLLQGITAAYAKTWLEVDQLGPSFIVCSPLNTADQPEVDPLKHIVNECCTALCAAAASIGPTILPSESGSLEFQPVLIDVDPCLPSGQRAPPGEPGAIRDARAPPAISI